MIVEARKSRPRPRFFDYTVTMIIFLVGSAAFGLSIAAKFLADAFLDERVALLGSYAGLVKSFNPGVAFGISFSPPLQFVLIIGAIIAVIILARSSAHSLLERVAFGFIIGGAMANIVDRIGDGLVTDYFQVGSFPIFNVADSFITIGVLLLVFPWIIHRQQR